MRQRVQLGARHRHVFRLAEIIATIYFLSAGVVVTAFVPNYSSGRGWGTVLRAMPSGITTRELTSNDQESIWNLLMYAAHEESIEPVKSLPALTQYAANYGTQPGDIGVAAIDTAGRVVGAAWCRLLPQGFAFVEDDLPELAFAVLPEYQKQGIGGDILGVLVENLKATGARGMVLSCRSGNPAMTLYERCGFKIVPSSDIQNRDGGTSITMSLFF